MKKDTAELQSRSLMTTDTSFIVKFVTLTSKMDQSIVVAVIDAPTSLTTIAFG